MRWRDLRFHLYDRNPQLFGAFEASLDELHAIVFDFSQRQKYDLTRHALTELASLLSAYLLARNNSLRVPTSNMAIFFPSENTFDPLLTRQLDRFRTHAARGISKLDQEFVKEVAAALKTITMSSMKSRSYFHEQGESSVASFVLVHLTDIIQDAALRKLDDVALEGADHLKDVCAEMISQNLYFSALTPIADLERLATLSVMSLNDVVLSVNVRSLADCLLHNCIHGEAGTHVGDHILRGLVRVTKARLASSLGLDMTRVNFSVGPFISPTERTSFAQINMAVVNGIAECWRTKNFREGQRLRSIYEELHDRTWLDFAEMGMEAVKKNSFLLHYINSTVEESVKVGFWLLKTINMEALEAKDFESAHERQLVMRFREQVENKLLWETTGIYSRIIPSMFEHKQFSNLEDTVEIQTMIAFWALRAGLQRLVTDATSRIADACQQLQNQEYNNIYGSARLAINIAQIGIYALAVGDEAIFGKTVEQYRTLRDTFLEHYPEEHFVGDFNSAERELLNDRRNAFVSLNSRDAEFYSVAQPERIRAFFAALG